MRALSAAMLRELLIFFRYPGWVVSVVVWPVLFPAAYIFLARALAGPDPRAQAAQALGTPDYVGYILIGTLLWMWVNTTLWTIGSALRKEQLGGTLESNWLAPQPRAALLFGAALAHAVVVLWMVAVATAAFTLVYGLKVRAPAESALLFLANVPWVYGLGLLFASLVVWAKEANGMVHAVRSVFLIFCGMSFPVAVMPGWMQAVGRALPLTHGIDALRMAALAGAGWREVAPELAWLLVWGAALSVCGFLAFAFTDRRMRELGTTGTY
ncbi:MAG: ABC transporter permease [Clostridia bacterium]|nr:ABC transporter permease [Clostridia bacterium]